METQRIVYNDKVVRQFTAASIFWGIVGMSVGVWIALQLAFWPANAGELFSFGRLRPVHTNAVIFAFVGNMIFAGVYYSMQRLLKARVPSDLLASINFWGWQAIIVAGAVTLPLGFTQAKEYAELEWPIDIAIAIIWVVFAINFFWTIKVRNEKHLYVALWFYLASIVAIAMLHIVNSLVIPVFALKSYSIFGGVQDALVQWWYGHNAVAFFLTTPILGIMYYFLPKAAGRPVYSYRLSIMHFWSLVFIYIWAGPHHLLNTALPDWAQSIGMIFSLMLWAPSWGGMINGLLTLRGAWDKMRRDPVLKFLAAGVTFYGMSTFEGPLLSIKAVSSLSHYTDWIIAHVHGGALGWNGFMAAGMFYWLVPRLYKTKLHSESAANFHFWIGTVGILLYIVSMWVAGITQGLMWRAENEAGGLMYPTFVETLLALEPMYWTRLVGGTLYLLGFVLMVWNLLKTVQAGKAHDGEAEVTVIEPVPAEGKQPVTQLLFGKPVIILVIALAIIFAIPFTSQVAATVLLVLALAAVLIGAIAHYLTRSKSITSTWHHAIEGRAVPFTILTVVAAAAGGAAEIIPAVVAAPSVTESSENEPYAALELEGRDVFIAEGCYTCHSQMIRPFKWETARYGDVSQAKDSVWDHPFQWGSRRIGPDLARVGGKYSDVWHYEHLMDPRAITPGSNMPPYPHLVDNTIDFEDTPSKLRAMRAVGVPYSAEQIQGATAEAQRHGEQIAASLAEEGGVEVPPNSQMVAVIGYLQRLGSYDSTAPPAEPGDGGDGVRVSMANDDDDGQEAR